MSNVYCIFSIRVLHASWKMCNFYDLYFNHHNFAAKKNLFFIFCWILTICHDYRDHWYMLTAVIMCDTLSKGPNCNWHTFCDDVHCRIHRFGSQSVDDVEWDCAVRSRLNGDDKRGADAAGRNSWVGVPGLLPYLGTVIVLLRSSSATDSAASVSASASTSVAFRT